MSGDNFDERTALTIVWIVLLVVFLIFPCCSSSRKRKIWRKRIKERRWHVYVAQEEPEDGFVAQLERYRAAQREDEAQRQGGTGNSLTQVAADIVWKEKEEPKLRRALADDLLREYTKELQKNDFVQVPTSPRSPQDDSEKDMAAEEEPTSTTADGDTDGDTENDVDVELGIPVVVPGENDMNSVEDEIDIFQSDSMMENAYRVRLPVPGSGTLQPNEEAEGGGGGGGGGGGETTREVPNGCAVCMDPFGIGDRICWSSNAGCPHAYHEKCLINWLLVLGRRRRMRMLRTISDDVDLTDYDMLCPCCRQDFVVKTGISNSDEERPDSQGF